MQRHDHNQGLQDTFGEMMYGDEWEKKKRTKLIEDRFAAVLAYIFIIAVLATLVLGVIWLAKVVL